MMRLNQPVEDLTDKLKDNKVGAQLHRYGKVYWLHFAGTPKENVKADNPLVKIPYEYCPTWRYPIGIITASTLGILQMSGSAESDGYFTVGATVDVGWCKFSMVWINQS